MSGDVVTIHSRQDIEQRVKHVLLRINAWDYETPLAITLKPYTNPRSLSQNALSHKWYRELSESLIMEHTNATEQNMKLLMKRQFLGVEDIRVHGRIITDQVKHTSGLDKGEMCHYLDQVYNWAWEHNILLTVPENSEYQQLKNRQVE